MTRKALVLDYLTTRRNAWVNGYDLQTPEVGGSEATRRLRELRDEGFNIVKRRHPGEGRDSYQYMLVMDEPASQVRMFQDEELSSVQRHSSTYSNESGRTKPAER